MEAALTTNETFLVGVKAGLAPRICLADSTEDVSDDDETKACVAIFLEKRLETCLWLNH